MSWSATSGNPDSHSCGCIGPQNGEPLCPCMMRGVRVQDGRYVRSEDLGPVVAPKAQLEQHVCKSCGDTSYSKSKFCSECGARQ